MSVLTYPVAGLGLPAIGSLADWIGGVGGIP